jgi:hypothetical protein
VTIEIDTEPKELDLPPNTLSTSVKRTMNMSEIGEELNKIGSEFQIPPELME